MNIFQNNLEQLSQVIDSIVMSPEFAKQVSMAGEKIKDAVKSGKKILIAGNGGSAAEAQHFSAELIGRFIKERESYPGIALTTDSSILTAVGNDYGFDSIFERQVDGLGNEGDILVVLSTSGNSENLIKAVKRATEKKMYTIGLLGKDGGHLKDIVDASLVIPSSSTARIQEIHLLIIHSWCEMVESV